MRQDYLQFSPPCLGEEEIQAVTAVLKEGLWLSSGPRTKQFEEDFKKYIGAEDAVALNSCTAGLHLGLVVHGVGEGDEVITTPLTFCATANVVEHTGARVVLADIDPETLLIDPKEIERRLTTKTRVIMPVHYAGHPCDMNRINALAKQANAHVIEDAAHCLPSKIGDKMVGQSENLTAFSFYATKNITTGEGGMLTGPKALIDQARMMALHGMSKGAYDRFKKGGNWRYDVPDPGFKYNMTDAASAMGIVQLKRLDELYEQRMKIVKFYDQAFASVSYLKKPVTRQGYQSSYHLYPIQLELEQLSISRDEFIVQMQERNIGCSVHYQPVHMHSYYAKKYGWRPDSFPVAARAFERMISLPLSSRHTLQDAADVVEAVEEVAKKFKR